MILLKNYIKDYINEARGVVTDENSWSKLVDYLVDKWEEIYRESYYHIEPGDIILPPWMSYLDIFVNDYNGVAYYNQYMGKIVDGKLTAHIGVSKKFKFNKKRLRSVFEHELQHAFDDYITKTKKGKDSMFDNDYEPLTGFESPKYNKIKHWWILDHPGWCNIDHIIYILNSITYAFHETETNAFLREFSLYIKNYSTKYNKWKWSDLMYHPNFGGLPLILIDYIYYVYNNIDKYKKINRDEQSWKYIMNVVNSGWSKRILRKQFIGDDKKSFLNVLKEVIDKRIPKILSRYKRVLKDSGLEIKNAPDWF